MREIIYETAGSTSAAMVALKASKGAPQLQTVGVPIRLPLGSALEGKRLSFDPVDTASQIP